MAKAKPKIEFLGNAAMAAPSGGLRAMVGYRFQINDGNQIVAWAPLVVGKLSQDQVRLAARILIELEMEGGADLSKVTELVLDNGAISRVTGHPDWSVGP